MINDNKNDHYIEETEEYIQLLYDGKYQEILDKEEIILGEIQNGSTKLSIFDKQYNIFFCDSKENKLIFLKYVSLILSCDVSKKIFVSIDLEYGEDRIGLIEVKFDIYEHPIYEETIILDPYDFVHDQYEKLIFSIFFKCLLCSGKENIFKLGHGIYSLDYDNIKEQLLCGEQYRYLYGFIYNLIDTRIHMLFTINYEQIVTDGSGNDVYTYYNMEKIITEEEKYEMIENQRYLDNLKKKGFSLTIKSIEEEDVYKRYVVYDIIYLYESLKYDHREIETFNFFVSYVTFYTEIRREGIEFNNINLIIKNISELIKTNESEYMNDIFEKFLYFFSIHKRHMNTLLMFMSFYNIEQTKMMVVIFIKLLFYNNYNKIQKTLEDRERNIFRFFQEAIFVQIEKLEPNLHSHLLELEEMAIDTINYLENTEEL